MSKQVRAAFAAHRQGRTFKTVDEWNTFVTKTWRDERVTKSTEEREVMDTKVSFADIICGSTTIAKRARKGEVPRGTIYGDPVSHDDEDDDDDDAKSAAKKIMAYARQLDDDDDDDEDAKKNKLKAFAKRWGVTLKDADDDDDDDDDDEQDAKHKDADDDSDDDELKAGEKHSRGIAHHSKDVAWPSGPSKKARSKSTFDHAKTRVSFASTIFPRSDGDSAAYVHDVTAPDSFGPRAADQGQDALARKYSDMVQARLGGGLRDKSGSGDETDIIPRAGGIDPWLGDTRSTPNSGFRPMRGGEGDANHTGGEDRGGRLAQPRQDYVDNVPGPTRVGDMRLMNPGNSGIAGPSGFRPSFNGGMLRTLKSAPRKGGLFRNLLVDGVNAGGSTQPPRDPDKE